MPAILILARVCERSATSTGPYPSLHCAVPCRFTRDQEVMPISAAPEPKRRFVPSKHEEQKWVWRPSTRNKSGRAMTSSVMSSLLCVVEVVVQLLLVPVIMRRDALSHHRYSHLCVRMTNMVTFGRIWLMRVRVMMVVRMKRRMG